MAKKTSAKQRTPKKKSSSQRRAGKQGKTSSKKKDKKNLLREIDFSKIAIRAEKKIKSKKHPLQAPGSFKENVPKSEHFRAVLESPKGEKSGGFDREAVQRALAKAREIERLKGIKAKHAINRMPTGIEGLDELIEGGFERGSSVLVVGSAGTGKTLFGLQFLYYGALKYKEPGLFISFEEEKESLYRHSVSFGWDFDALEKKNLFRVIEYKPHQVEKLMQEGGGPIRDVIKEMGAKRLVIDSITSYGLLFRDEYTKRQNILELFDFLNKWGCTSIIISELPPKSAEIKEGSVGFLTDAIISLYYSKEEEKGIRVHSCEILKMRGTHHTNKLLAIGFEKNGIRIYPEVEVF